MNLYLLLHLISREWAQSRASKAAVFCADVIPDQCLGGINSLPYSVDNTKDPVFVIACLSLAQEQL